MRKCYQLLKSSLASSSSLFPFPELLKSRQVYGQPSSLHLEYSKMIQHKDKSYS